MKPYKLLVIILVLGALPIISYCTKKQEIPHTISYTDTNKTFLKLVLVDSLNADTIYTLMNFNLVDVDTKTEIPLLYNFPEDNFLYQVKSGLYQLENEQEITKGFSIRENAINIITLFCKGGEMKIINGKDTSNYAKYPVQIYKFGDLNQKLIPFDSSRQQYMPIGIYRVEVKCIPPAKFSVEINKNTVHIISLNPTGTLVLSDFDASNKPKLYTSKRNEIDWSISDVDLLLNANGIELQSGPYQLSWLNELGLKKNINLTIVPKDTLRISKEDLNTIKTQNKTGIDSVYNFKIKFLRPNYKWWKVEEETRGNNSYVMNVRDKSVSKRIHFEINSASWEDVSDEKVQQRFIQYFSSFNLVSKKFDKGIFGTRSFIVKCKSTSGKTNLYAILAFENGFRYQLILSCYKEEVENDFELNEILSSIKIYQ